MTPDEQTRDADWFGAIRQGDASAFAEMVRAYYTGLFDYAFGITRSAETAEDLVQDILLYVWENRARWHPPTTVRAYLYRAVRNRALNVLRDRKPQAALDMAESVPDETEPGSDLQYRELLVQYREAVQALPERRRQVFTLSRLYGLTYEEVAETLGISINTVRTQMTAALKHLRERLSDFLLLFF